MKNRGFVKDPFTFFRSTNLFENMQKNFGGPILNKNTSHKNSWGRGEEPRELTCDLREIDIKFWTREFWLFEVPSRQEAAECVFIVSQKLKLSQYKFKDYLRSFGWFPFHHEKAILDRDGVVIFDKIISEDEVIKLILCFLFSKRIVHH